MRRWIAYLIVFLSILVADPAQAADRAELVLTFDDPPSGQSASGPWREGCFADSASSAVACIRAENGGTIRRTERKTPGGTSPAIGFPGPGDGTAILDIPHTPRLNPKGRDFVVSAMLDLTGSEAATGSNLVQKGVFDDPGGQWKLQVDKGVPSCRIAGIRDGRKVSAMVSGPLISGRGWASLRCERRGSTLTISVDGKNPVAASQNASMSIANKAEVTVGGRATGAGDTDQLHGNLDRVVVDFL